MSDTGVLRVITRLNIGGPARQALLLTRELATTHPTTLVAGTPPPEEGELLDPRVPVTRVPLVRSISPRDDVAAVAAVRHLLVTHRPALMHTHMAKAGTVSRIAAHTIRHRPVLVHTFHGHVLDGYFTPRKERAFLDIERALAKRTDALVAVSPEVRDDLLALGIGRPEQWRVVPLGLDLSAHLAVSGRSGRLRQQLGLADDVPLVGTAGRLVPIKDIGTLLDAIARLPGVHLALLGDGEERAALEARTAALGLRDRVHFTGWWHDMPAALADIDVAALSSLNEGTPVTLIEAAACGRPAVATDVGGVRSVVVDGVNGLVVPPSDPAALAGAVEAVLGDPARAAAMGAAGRARSDLFSADRLVRDIRALYDELLN